MIFPYLLTATYDHHHSVRTEIQSQYDRWSKAYMSHNSEVLVAILSPDYTLVTSTKATLDYPTYTAKLRLLKEIPPETTQYSTAIRNLTVTGDEAEVLSEESMKSKGVDPKTTKPVWVDHRHLYRDSWIHYDAGWRLRKTITQKESTTIYSRIQP